jgi:hypothetical protein
MLEQKARIGGDCQRWKRRRRPVPPKEVDPREAT